MLWRALEWGGELLLKIWIKTRKIVGSAALLFRLRSSFYTSRGGDRRPQFAVWLVGVSWQILHGTSFIKLTSILVHVFTITFHTAVRAVVRKTDFKRG